MTVFTAIQAIRSENPSESDLTRIPNDSISKKSGYKQTDNTHRDWILSISGEVAYGNC
jgi:hypothetical protein